MHTPSYKPHPWESDRWQVYTQNWDVDGSKVIPPFPTPWHVRPSQMEPVEAEFATFAEAIAYAQEQAVKARGPYRKDFGCCSDGYCARGYLTNDRCRETR